MKIGFSSMALMDDAFQWVYDLEDIGFQAWEVVGEGQQKLDEKVRAKVMDVYETTNLDISVHLPYSDLNIASVNQGIWEETLRQMLKCIELASGFANLAVIHPGWLSPLGSYVPDRAMEHMVKALQMLCDAADESGMSVAIENMINMDRLMCRHPEEMQALLEDVDRSNIGITFDVGHANTNSNISDFFTEGIRANIVHMHLHDNNGEWDDHLPLGEGNIDWVMTMSHLKDYGVTAIIEGHNLVEGRKSLEYLESII